MHPTLPPSTAPVLTPRRAGLRERADDVVEVLVRVQAPDAPQTASPQRPPQALALVLDRSGSMQGRPMQEARRCAEAVVAQMRPDDSVALVQFSHDVQRLWPAIAVGNGSALRHLLAGIDAGGKTDLHGGWKEGADCLGDIAGQGLKRVILLSDGRANAGVTDPVAIAAQCAEWSARGITTSTYGLGPAFNEELMMAMARAGGGNAYYGETAEDLMEPFQQELSLLRNLCLRDLRLQVQTPDGIVCEALSALTVQGGGWRLPDLAWGAEAWVVLRLKVPAGGLPARGERLSLLQVAVSACDLDGQPVSLERTSLALRVQSAAEHDGLADDELVARRLTEIAASRALGQLRGAATEGDWLRVDRLLALAERDFDGNPWVQSVLSAMKSLAADRSRERFGKEALYSSAKLAYRLADKHERPSEGGAVDDPALPSYLRLKPAQGRGKT